MMAKRTWKTTTSLEPGQTVKTIKGDGKVERLVTDKETFDNEYGGSCCWFPSKHIC